MKLAFVFILSVIPIIASAEEVNKWVDDKGKVHYGNVPPATEAIPVKKLEIQDTFDQKEYEKAKERHVETEQFGKELEKERKAGKKKRRRKKQNARRASSSRLPLPAHGSICQPHTTKLLVYRANPGSVFRYRRGLHRYHR